MDIEVDRLVTIDELADMIKISGKTIAKKYDCDVPQEVRGRNVEISLSKKVFGREPRVSLEKGLAKTCKWIRCQLVSE
jgi:nucleoside-diphosphate-sugar epimerase